MKTNDKDMQRILEKLRKLMDLKASALECGEPGEANAAAAGITRLLREYDLTLQDIPDSQKPQEPVDIEPVPFRFTYMQHKWYWMLLDVLAKHNNCTIIRSRKKEGSRVVECVYNVIGRERHRKVVLYLVSFCAHRFIRIGQRRYAAWKVNYLRSTGRTPPSLGEYMKSFLAGCVDGLHQKLCDEQSQLPQERITALVVAHQADIDGFLASMNVKTARTRAVRVDAGVAEEGREVGRSISLQKGLDGHGQNIRFLEGNSGISG